MLCNPEKMPITEWPHPQIEQRGVPAMTASTKLMERSSSTQDHQQHPQQQPQPPPQQQPLKCPRCDSSNTKFCYYNNYSLSQPRHFCKACKRYWTRGGTLRNVPVGGGCRKNKRVKRPSAASGTVSAAGSGDSSVYGLAPPADMGPLGSFPASLRSLNLENMNINVPNSAASSSGFDLPHLWMNFPAAVPTTTTSDGEYQFNPNPNPNHSSLLPDFSLLGSSASSILASCTLQNNPKVLANSTSTRQCNDFQMFFPMGGLHQNGGGHGNMIKGVKMEEESMNTVGNKMGSTNWYDNSMENNNMGSHDSSVYNNWSSSSAAWPDHATNYGSSITPLI